MGRTFTKENYQSSHLLHLGRDHFYCGFELLNGITPRTVKEGNEKIKVCVFDSGGYLIRLGIELLLKAILLEETGAFTDEHNLKKIQKQINSLNDLSPSLLKVLNEIDGYFFSRYGKDNKDQPVEIGNENIGSYFQLFKAILKKMPLSLRNDYKSLDPYRKSGRMLYVFNPNAK